MKARYSNAFQTILQVFTRISAQYLLEEKLQVLQTEPFLEIVAGPWHRGTTQNIPDILLQTVLQVLKK